MLLRKLALYEPPEQIKLQVIQRCEELGYLNDQVYAERLIESNQKYGQARLKQILAAKLVPRDIVESLQSQMRDLDKSKIDIVAEKKWNQIIKKPIPGFQAKDKLFKYLIRQGFSFDASKSAVNQLMNSLPPSLETED